MVLVFMINLTLTEILKKLLFCSVIHKLQIRKLSFPLKSPKKGV